eukprot:Protomagalhaensia_wolfi_Nauph_80__1354@NODE_1809_length_1326_cov_67_624709_g1412_i0_p3_GENE_NODE_1809_length_1326_cov_67_624709_g1412_i0NODE_1809_length_1326_cov_67_624709_g1412_i0_p3_ORF_typecomplete_len126_score3_82PDE6_gamma/PF04868_12/2_7e02PDE6_gamma/PF04868_12/0_64_NODE_1809_length_1326_cov_67_624709_g1412_i0577954
MITFTFSNSTPVVMEPPDQPLPVKPHQKRTTKMKTRLPDQVRGLDQSLVLIPKKKTTIWTMRTMMNQCEKSDGGENQATLRNEPPKNGVPRLDNSTPGLSCIGSNSTIKQPAYHVHNRLATCPSG